jgi:ubiquinone/menaquinone biosynthesis C-methylase UbiE
MATTSNASERAMWAKRSIGWLRTGPKGESPDDTQNQALIAAAGIASGDVVLDLASGGGEPAISIALCVGPAGCVVASDFSPEMLVGSRQRASALELAQIKPAVADMQFLPFAAASFDAVTCRFGLMFPIDRNVAAAEARRVLKPGAKAAYMVWGPHDDNALHAVLAQAVRGYFGEPEPNAPPRRHTLGKAGALSAVLESAGFSQIEEREFRAEREFSTEPAFWLNRIKRNNAAQFDSLSSDEQADLAQAVIDAYEPYRQGDKIRLMQHVRIGIGAAPG